MIANRRLIIICLTLSIGSSLVSSEKDLYQPTDDVLRLSTDTFKPTVYDNDNNITHVVQFYNTFCGHCQLFAPIYKELATRVRNWTSVVRVAGIDCSKDENIATCSESGIEGYPTIFIYPPNARFQDKVDAPLSLRSLGIEWNVDTIEETIVTYVGNLTATREKHPLVADAMQPISVTSLDKITRIYPSNKAHDVADDFETQQDLMLIVESDTSFLGRKLIIEFYRIHSKLELRRAFVTNQALLKNILPADEYSKLEHSLPVLLRVNGADGNRAQVLVRGEASHILPTVEEAERQDFIQHRFQMFFEQYYFEELKEIDGHDKNRQNNVAAKRIKTVDVDVRRELNNELEIYYLVHNDPISSKKIFAVDILKGISYMITHEIRLKGNLSPQDFNTVRNILTILRKYLPLDKWDATLSMFILDLRTRLDENRAVYEKVGITSQQMTDLLQVSGMDAVKLRYNRENWTSCYDSERQSKGYTCSLWLLFHTLTVGEYTKAAPVSFRPTLVLTTMRDYIINFLGCTVCSSNFARETEGLETKLVHRNSSVMWLWDTHNRVNQRLNQEKQDRKKSLAEIVFPKYQRCQSCYKSERNIGQDGRTLDDIEWNSQEILNFMVDLYGPDRVISPVELATMLSNLRGKVNYDVLYSELHDGPGSMSRPDLNRSNEQWNIQGIFSASDMSICLFLYFCCIVIVVMVCFSLNPRFKRSNSKSK